MTEGEGAQSFEEEVTIFFLCPVCFEASEHQLECHGHLMVLVNPGEPGDERRKPLIRKGRIISNAPRWFLEQRRSRVEDDEQ